MLKQRVKVQKATAVQRKREMKAQDKMELIQKLNFNKREIKMLKSKKAPPRWSNEECKRFIRAVELYGKNFQKISEYVGTRDFDCCRSHAAVVKSRILADPTTEGAHLLDILSMKLDTKGNPIITDPGCQSSFSSNIFTNLSRIDSQDEPIDISLNFESLDGPNNELMPVGKPLTEAAASD